MDSFLNRMFLNNAIREWLIAAAIILAALLILNLIRTLVMRRVHKFAASTETDFDDFLVRVIESSVMPILYMLSFNAGAHYLNLPPRADSVLRVAALLVVTFFMLRIITSAITYGFQRVLVKQGRSDAQGKQARGILLIIQFVVWTLGIIFLIDNLGYDITTLVAGLGIGGIAIALAAQAILGDLFSYFVIFFDKPFEIGDFIIVDEKLGTVEYIGIKTTRVRTLNGEQLVFSNTDLTNSRVHNYKRMQERRIVFKFGILYGTPKELVAQVPVWIKEIINSCPDTRFDRAHFSAFGESSLDFEAVYYVLTPDYTMYMDKQQYINLKMMEVFAGNNIQFAYPTRTLYLQKEEVR